MLKEYEFTVIAKADLPDADLNTLLGKYEKYMTKDGGQILKKDVWGNKKLAFPINKQYRGHYTNYDFVGDSANLTEIERLMRIDENILRYLSIALGSNVDVTERLAELAKEAQAAKDAYDDRDDDRGDRDRDRGDRDRGDRDRGDRDR